MTRPIQRASGLAAVVAHVSWTLPLHLVFLGFWGSLEGRLVACRPWDHCSIPRGLLANPLWVGGQGTSCFGPCSICPGVVLPPTQQLCRLLDMFPAQCGGWAGRGVLLPA